MELYTRVSVLNAACSLALLNAGEHARTTNDEVHTYSTPISFSQADNWSMSLFFKSCNSAHSAARGLFHNTLVSWRTQVTGEGRLWQERRGGWLNRSRNSRELRGRDALQHSLRGRIGRTRVAGKVVHLRHAGPLRPVRMASMCGSSSKMVHDWAGSGPIRVRHLSSGPRSVSCVPQNRNVFMALAWISTTCGCAI